MSVVMCECCDQHVDSDEGTIQVWEPKVVCENCFDKMSAIDAWELALEAAAGLAERFMGSSQQALAEKIRKLKA